MFFHIGTFTSEPMSTRNSKKRKLWETDLQQTDPLFQNPTRRRENDISYLISYLNDIRDARHDRRERKPKRERFQLLRHFTLEQRSYVVYLRFGSLTDDSNPIRTYREVSERSGIRISSCFRIVHRWRRDGRQIRNNCHGCPSNRKVTDEIQRQLVNPKLLQEWCHLSLVQRTLKFEQLFGFKVSVRTISHYYKLHGINYIKPQYAYFRKLAKREEVN